MVQLIVGGAMVVGAVVAFLTISGFSCDIDPPEPPSCAPAYVKPFDAATTLVEAPDIDPEPGPASTTGSCTVTVRLGKGGSADVYFRLPAGRSLIDTLPAGQRVSEVSPGLYVFHGIPSGRTVGVVLVPSQPGDQCHWGVGRWDDSLGRWAEYQDLTTNVVMAGPVARPDPPAAGASPEATTTISSRTGSTSALFYRISGGLSDLLTVDAATCQQAVDLLQSGTVFFALRYPVDPAMGGASGWLDPVVIRGDDRPVLSLRSPDPLVTLPLEIRSEWLQLASERLPSAPGEAWTVLGAQPAPRVTCPADLEKWAWSIDLQMSLDFRTDPLKYLDHVMESYLCYAGSNRPQAVAAAQAAGDGVVRADGVTCFGPFPIRAVDWTTPDPPYLAVLSKSLSAAAPGDHVEIEALLMSLGSTAVSLDLSVSSSLGLPWKLYAGDVSKPDLGSPITGPVDIEADGYAYVWMVVDVPDGVSGFDTARLTAVESGKKPSWTTHILQVGAWSAPPAGAGWRSWIPVGSHAPGAHGSNWRTDAGLFNPSFSAVRADVRLHAADRVHSVQVDVPAHGQVILSDVVGSTGYTGGGPLEIEAPGELLVTSRSYSAIAPDAACFPSGTLGQALDGAMPSAGLVAGQRAFIPQLVENDAFRTNIGLSNTGGTAAKVVVHLHDGDGTKLASYTVSLDPGQWKQDNRPFANRAGKTALKAGYAVVEVSSGAGVVAYGSVVDNRTNDPTTIPMVPDLASGAKRTWIPVAVHAPGAHGSRWRTTLGLLNPGGSTAHVTLSLYASSHPVSTSYSLAPGAQLIVDDVAGALGVDGAGPLEVVSSSPVVVTSRTYTEIGGSAPCLPGGTLGQGLPATEPSEALTAGRMAFLPHLVENQRFRTNIGFANTGATEARVVVRLFDSRGAELKSFEVTVPAHTWLQENRPFAARAGRSDLDTAWASFEVTAGEGVLAYGSVVDNNTNDPTTVVPRRRL